MIRTAVHLSAALGLLLQPLASQAADHLDGAAVKTDHATDINDVYAWTSTDGTKVNLVMTVFPQADATAKFSSAAAYVLHTASKASLAATTSVPVDVICLPHPSGASTWHRMEPGIGLLNKALKLVAKHPAVIDAFADQLISVP